VAGIGCNRDLVPARGFGGPITVANPGAVTIHHDAVVYTSLEVPRQWVTLGSARTPTVKSSSLKAISEQPCSADGMPEPHPSSWAS
jgi:hypothetical protein